MDGLTYTHERFVAHSDTDGDGVVHFSRYLVYFEDALFDCCRRLGLDLALPDSAGTMAITGLQMSYRRALRFGQRCAVRIGVMKQRSFSIRLAVEIRVEEVLCAEGWVDVAFLARGDWSLSPVPLGFQLGEEALHGG